MTVRVHDGLRGRRAVWVRMAGRARDGLCDTENGPRDLKVPRSESQATSSARFCPFLEAYGL